MKAIILGDKSDIAKGLMGYLVGDGWEVEGWRRGQNLPMTRWDLVLIAIGRVAPVGHWWQVEPLEWDKCVRSNLSVPTELLRHLWPQRLENPAVCFMAGSNPQKPMSGYSAYNAGKMALLKLVEQLDFETPDARFFALGPGYVPTKIHKATLEAGWPNERIAKGGGTPIEKIYECLKWSLEQPKDVIGGRNIVVSDEYGPGLSVRLKNNPALFKLRRVE